MKAKNRIRTLLQLALPVLFIAVLAGCSRGYGCYYGGNDKPQKQELRESPQHHVLQTRDCART